MPDPVMQVIAKEQLLAAADTIERLRNLLRQRGEALAFAASVIKSGESWTPECERIIGRAMRETDSSN